MDENPFKGDAPPWVTTDRRPNSALAPLDKDKMIAMAQEAAAMASSSISRFVGPNQRFVADAERRRICHGEQLKGELDADTFRMHLTAYLEALRDLGQFELARQERERFAHHSIDFTTEAFEAACQRKDNHDCGCERETAVIDHAKGEVEIALDRRQPIGMVLCPYRGEVKPVYRCRHCGVTTVGTPERQQVYEGLRAQHEAEARVAVAKGQVLPRATADHQVLSK